MHISRLLGTSAKRSTRLNLGKLSLEQLKTVNPKDAELLLNTLVTKIEFKKEVHRNLFQHIKEYKTHYKEKLVCFDPKVAKSISKNIIESSEGDENTPFLDTDGCMCLVSRQFRTISNRPITVFQRDEKFFEPLENILKPLKIKQEILNVHQVLFHGEEYARYREQTKMYKNGWDNPIPSYSLFSTCAHGLAKSLSFKCLEAWSRHHDVTNHMFDNQRPEFYMLVSKRTFAHLTFDLNATGNGSLRRAKFNHIFRALFDLQPIETYPMRAFLPWHRLSLPKHPSGSILGKTYDDQADSLFLVKVRPKLDVGFGKEFNPYHFLYMVVIITRAGNNKLIETLESLLPDIGYDLIIKGGYKMKSTMKDVYPQDIVPLFNLLQSQKNYVNSGFTTAADLWGEGEQEVTDVYESRDSGFE